MCNVSCSPTLALRLQAPSVGYRLHKSRYKPLHYNPRQASARRHHASVFVSIPLSLRFEKRSITWNLAGYASLICLSFIDQAISRTDWRSGLGRSRAPIYPAVGVSTRGQGGAMTASVSSASCWGTLDSVTKASWRPILKSSRKSHLKRPS